MQRLFLLFFFISLNSCVKKTHNNKTEPINVFYDKAHDFREAKKIDSAIFYYNKAKYIFLQRNNRLGFAKCLLNLGIFATNRGDFFSGQEISLQAIPYFNPEEKDQHIFISSNYNNLALSTYELKNYKDALKFYRAAIAYDTVLISRLIYLNNMAKIYEDIKDYKKANNLYSQVLNKAPQTHKIYARALANIALSKSKQNPQYDPLPEFLTALSLRKKINDEMGLNFSYATLSDYYQVTIPDSALFYAKKMYQNTKKINSPDDRLLALQKLIKLSPSKETKNYFLIYEGVNDSLQSARSKAKNQFALIRYDTENQQADILSLKQENTYKKYQLSILIIFGVLFLISGILWYKKRKQRIELEAEKAIQENQLKTSKKVHDVVANGLYTIMTKLDNRDAFKNDPIVDEMEELYEKSRNISYEKTISRDTHFNEKLFNLVKSFESNMTEVLIFGNEGKIWTGLNDKTKYELEYILQELMVNMKKHSQASRVIIKFKQLNNQILINYTDNGKGIKDFSLGNGLRNTETRIKSISGLITFDTKPNQGLKVKISFPI